MQFDIILSVDIPRNEPINRFAPPKKIRRKLILTEGDEQYEYGYLEGEWTKGKHRKYCGTVNRADFEEIISWCELRAQDCETGGSLGFDGWQPAISFDYEGYESAIVNCYATPIPSVNCGQWRSDESLDNAWNRIKRAVISLWG